MPCLAPPGRARPHRALPHLANPSHARPCHAMPGHADPVQTTPVQAKRLNYRSQFRLYPSRQQTWHMNPIRSPTRTPNKNTARKVSLPKTITPLSQLPGWLRPPTHGFHCEATMPARLSRRTLLNRPSQGRQPTAPAHGSDRIEVGTPRSPEDAPAYPTPNGRTFRHR
jgi:hypothetical protein